MTSVFFSYSHADENLRDRLEVHLAMLQRQGQIDVWHDRRLPPGDHIDKGISEHLEQADLILLLVSPEFLASPYCYDVEMTRSMERHAAGRARVLPVILRPCDWHAAPFGKLLATPQDWKPITRHPDLDEAFLEVTNAIKAAIGTQKPAKAKVDRSAAPASAPASRAQAGPRSSNLRIRKAFTEADKDRFLDDAFEFIAKFFENSLAELSGRNSGIECAFKRVDAVSFTATVYVNGDATCRCSIRHGGSQSFGAGITYSRGGLRDTSYNESLSVEHDEQGLFLRPLGMAMSRGTGSGSNLTFEGAGEYYWSIFVEPLQQ
jgi:hypothetical protein